MLIFLGWVSGCGGQQVVWDSTSGGDAVQDLAVAFLLFGTKEGDEEQIAGPHVAGGSLTMNVKPRGGSADPFHADTLEPSIAEVVQITPTFNGIEIDIEFHRAGTTDLFVYDERGTVLDVQRLAVRVPTAATLHSWDDLAAEIDTPLSDPIHVVPPTSVSLALSWRDETGENLAGGRLLSVDDSDATTGASVTADFTGEVDTVEVNVDRSAPPGSFPFVIASPTIAFTRELQIHDRTDVDRLAVEVIDPRGESTQGLLRAEVFAGADRMVGAPVTFAFDGETWEGTTLEWSNENGGLTPIEVCFDAICEETSVDGVPVGVFDAAGATCGCHTAPGVGWLWPAGLLALAARRRRG